ncbi:hypothetical protein ACQ4N7_20220 [Nodosilinea sp. AN01ver1]|uniref:hypothetical protein n=1 Tax=Nodosilinea sp. AN01ver1 TaxID=3423362 RepID=UPI003D31F72A
MKPIVILQSPSTFSPEFEAIKDEALNKAKLGFYKAAAYLENPVTSATPTNLTSIEAVSLNFLKTSKSISQRQLTRLGKASTAILSNLQTSTLPVANPSGRNLPETPSRINLPRPVNRFPQSSFAPYSIPSRSWQENRIDLSPQVKLSNKTLQHLKNKDDLLVYQLLEDAGITAFMPISSGESKTSSPASSTKHNEFRLNLLKLKCIDPVDGEISDWFDNEISIGGMGIDSTGQEIRVTESYVSSFKIQQTYSFKPAKRFVGFDLNRSGIWPRIFTVTLAAAEKDLDGGFIEFLQQLWGILEEYVKELLTAAIAAGITAAGTATGFAAEASGLVGGTIIGSIVGAALGAFTAWVFDSLDDDIFDPVIASISLPSNTTLFDGNSKTSPPFKTQFSRTNALYELTYNWELV